jgi:hypothetical protein
VNGRARLHELAWRDGLDGGHLELERDLLVNEDAAGLEQGVPEQGVPIDAPVLAVDDRGAFDADPLVVILDGST